MKTRIIIYVILLVSSVEVCLNRIRDYNLVREEEGVRPGGRVIRLKQDYSQEDLQNAFYRARQGDTILLPSRGWKEWVFTWKGHLDVNELHK